MKNKGLIISLVIFAGILVMFLVTIFLTCFQDSSNSIFKKKETEMSVRPTIEESQKEITKKEEIGYSISHYTFNEGINVDIEYPVIYGMENKTYENNINQKLSINATAILLLHEDKDKIDSMSVSCTVQNFDEKKITVTYEGEMYFKTESTKKTTTKKSSNGTSTKKSNTNVIGDPNYDNYGSPASGINYDSYNAGSIANYDNYSPSSYQVPQQSPISASPQSSANDSNAPISGRNNTQMYPGANNVTGFASTKPTSKKVFYTSTVNLDECLDEYLAEYAVIPELAKYAKSNDCELINVSENEEVKVRKYIQKMKQADIQNILQNADYQNIGLKTWPKSFSYRKGNYIYFTLPVSHELGDYALIRYSYTANK